MPNIHQVLTEVKTEHRILLPFPICGSDEQLGLNDAVLELYFFEQLAPSLEDGGKGGDKQRLPEATRPAQEVRFALGDHLVDKRGLVNIDISILTDALEALYAYGVFSHLS